MSKEFPDLEEQRPARETVAQFVEALTLLAEYKLEVERLEEILHRNSKLSDYCWIKKGGELLSIYEMEDSHLLNSFNLLRRNGQESKQLLAEIKARNLPMPLKHNAKFMPLAFIASKHRDLNEDEDEDEDGVDHPF